MPQMHLDGVSVTKRHHQDCHTVVQPRKLSRIARIYVHMLPLAHFCTYEQELRMLGPSLQVYTSTQKDEGLNIFGEQIFAPVKTEGTPIHRQLETNTHAQLTYYPIHTPNPRT